MIEKVSLTEKNTRYDSMRKVHCRVCHITETQKVELCVPCATHSMNRHQDRPGYQTSRQADGAKDSQKAKEEISVHRRMMKDVRISNFEEFPDPVDEP